MAIEIETSNHNRRTETKQNNESFITTYMHTAVTVWMRQLYNTKCRDLEEKC